MPSQPLLSKANAAINAQLDLRNKRQLLRVIACGSVDDGKSTLIGRMLYECAAIYDDQLAALLIDSKRHGTRGGGIDFAILLDGLLAEREQNITIDVAYRFFSTAERRYVLADAPGHEQYTHNMITGASTAHLVIILVDARKGVITQTRRHTYLAALLGIRDAVLAVNKMDLVGYSPAVFAAIDQEFREFAARVGLTNVTAIPVVAVDGDNVVSAPSERMPWHGGPSLLQHLNSVRIEERDAMSPFRLPVQWVIRPDGDFRGVAGLVVSGAIRVGSPVLVLPSGRRSHVTRILLGSADIDTARAGQSITLTLRDALDVSRGDVLVAPDAPPELADQFQATLMWFGEEPLLPGRSYLARIGTRTLGTAIAPLKYKVNVDTFEHVAAKRLESNEIGVGTLQLAHPVVFEPYAVNRDLGGFLLIDRLTNATVGAGLLQFALRRSHNVRWQQLDVNKAARAALKGQRPCVVWFTGLSGAGKSTIANLVERRLHNLGHHTYLLDGDNVRHGLNRDLGFSPSDRVENVRRVMEVAALMADAGLIVLVSLISPFRAERRAARELNGEGGFFEVFVDTPLDVAEARDPKGLYQKARAGLLENFTGLDSAYERPEAPEMHIQTIRMSAAEGADAVVDMLNRAGVISDA